MGTICRFLPIVLPSLFAAAIATPAIGTITVFASYSVGANVSFNPTSGADISVSVSNPNNASGRLVSLSIVANDSNDIVGEVKLTNSQASNPVNFHVTIGNATHQAKEWKGFVVPSQISTRSTVLVISPNSSMDITGPVQTARVGNWTTLGTLKSSLTVTGENDPVTLLFGAIDRLVDGSGNDLDAVRFSNAVTNLTLRCSSGDMAGRIAVLGGTVSEVSSATGNIRADIIATGQNSTSTILLVSAANGEIRGPGDTLNGSGIPADSVAWPNRIRIQSYRSIGTIVSKRICAHVDANTELSGSAGQLNRLYASDSSSSGGFYGSVSALLYKNQIPGAPADEPVIEVAGIQAAAISNTPGIIAVNLQSPIVVGSGRGPITFYYQQASVSPKFARIESAGSLGPITMNVYGTPGVAKAKIIAAGPIERIEAVSSNAVTLDVDAPTSTISNVVTHTSADLVGTWNVGRIERSDIGGIGVPSGDSASLTLREMTNTDFIRVRRGLSSTSSITVGGASPNHLKMAGSILFNYGTLTENTSLWAGTVTVGGQTLSPKPSYTQDSRSFGGGSVSIETPRFNTTETGFFTGGSVPGSGTLASPWKVPQGLFNRSVGIPNPPGLRLSYYGPIVWPSAEEESPIQLYVVLPSSSVWVAHLTEVEIDNTFNSGSFSHEMIVRGALATPLLPGLYKVKLGEGLTHDFADGTPIQPRAFTSNDGGYLYFELLADCDKNGIADINEDPMPNCDRWGDCWADFNADGFLDFFDYEDYVICFEDGDCPPGRDADFNGDGFVDFFDYSDFAEEFESGCAE